MDLSMTTRIQFEMDTSKSYIDIAANVKSISRHADGWTDKCLYNLAKKQTTHLSSKTFLP